MLAAVLLDVGNKAGVMLGHSAIYYNDGPLGQRLAVCGENVPQKRVSAGKQITREVDGIAEPDFKLLLNGSHQVTANKRAAPAATTHNESTMSPYSGPA